MKNFKISLLMAAIGFSAGTFDNINKYGEGDIYGGTSGNDYTKRIDTYNPSLCLPIGFKPCAYSVTTEGTTIVTNNVYSMEELEGYANASPALVTRWGGGIYFGP